MTIKLKILKCIPVLYKTENFYLIFVNAKNDCISFENKIPDFYIIVINGLNKAFNIYF